MRSVAFASALLLIAATSISAAGEAGDADEACSEAGKTAAKIMEMRQRGTPLDDMMRLVRDKAAPAIEAALREITIQAYSKLRFETEEMQQKAIADFRDYVQLNCLKVAG